MKMQEQIMELRKSQGLHVVITREDGTHFNYYPATQAQKTDFISRAVKAGRTVIKS